MVKSARARYGTIFRLGAALVIVMTGLMAYVMLTSNITGLTYAVAKEEHKQAALVESNARLDDRLAALRSDERLAAVAAQLHMHNPQTFAVVRLLPPQKVAASHFPVLDSIAAWFGGPKSRARTR